MVLSSGIKLFYKNFMVQNLPWHNDRGVSKGWRYLKKMAYYMNYCPLTRLIGHPFITMLPLIWRIIWVVEQESRYTFPYQTFQAQNKVTWKYGSMWGYCVCGYFRMRLRPGVNKNIDWNIYRPHSRKTTYRFSLCYLDTSKVDGFQLDTYKLVHITHWCWNITQSETFEMCWFLTFVNCESKLIYT